MSAAVLWTIATATIREALRRRILLAALAFGVGFVLLFGLGFAMVQKDLVQSGEMPRAFQPSTLNFFLLAGLYAVNFLTVLTAACLPVDTLSGEIASGVMQTVAAKPVSRATIVFGKWIGHAIVLLGYVAFVTAGILAVAWCFARTAPPNLAVGVLLIALEGLVMLSTSIALGTRLSTIANAIACIGLYGIAFLGGWFEQIGSIAGVPAAGTIGVVASLIFPSESMWQLAAHLMQPAITRDLSVTPFSASTVPSPLMVVYAVAYVVVALALGVRWFTRRPL